VAALGVDQKWLFTSVFLLGATLAAFGGALQIPRESANLRMDLQMVADAFVVTVVGGMGSLPGAVLAGFLLGILQSLASMNEVKQIIPGIDQVIIYLVAVVVLLLRPRGLLGRAGLMET